MPIDGLTEEEKDLSDWLDENGGMIEHAGWDLRRKMLGELVSMVDKLEKTEDSE